MPGALLRGAAAASMISTARTNRAARHAIEQNTQMQAQAAQQPVAAPVAATPAPAQSELSAQLEELNNLKNQGILTQEEFDAKKRQLLGI